MDAASLVKESIAPMFLKIGITGHRDIEFNEKQKKQIELVVTEKIFDVVNPARKKLSTPFFFSVITSLAEGADRLFYSIAKEKISASLRVIIPFEVDEYYKTFSGSDSIAEFESIVSGAEDFIQVEEISKKNFLSENDLESIKQSAFKKTGQHIVNRCDILVAIVDFSRKVKPGGSLDILEYARKIGKPIIIVNLHHPDEITIEPGNNIIAHQLAHYERFNSLQIDDETMKNELRSEIVSFIPDSNFGIKEENKKLFYQRLLPFYLRASIASRKYQNMHRRAGTLVYSLAPLAVVCITAGLFFHKLSGLFSFFEFLILGFILFSIKRVEKNEAHKNWINNRYLAEILRSSIYKTLCGIKPSKFRSSFHTRLAHDTEEWMIKIYDEIVTALPAPEKHTEKEIKVLGSYLSEYWIRNQINFHDKKKVKTETIFSRLEFAGFIIFTAALFGAALHTLFSVSGFEEHMVIAAQILTSLVIILPAAGASISAIKNHREYSRLINRSHNMSNALTIIESEFNTFQSNEEFISLMDETEELMLKETQDWLTVMKHTKIEAA